jgi:predicted nucleotidyltransferase
MNSPVETKLMLLQLLQANRSMILSYGVSRIGLFGSFVRDEANSLSDVDFVVEFRPGKKNYDNYIELAYFLEELLGRKIELLTPKSMSPYIGPRIMKELEYVIAA